MTTEHACDQLRPRLSPYLDGDLSAEDARALEADLRRCPECQRELEDLRKTVGKLHGLKATAPPSFLADIQNQIQRRSRGRFFGKRHLLFGRVPFEWISLIMIVAMLVYYIAVMQGSPTDVAPAP